MGDEPRLVVHNTFLEFDDHEPIDTEIEGRPRAFTDSKIDRQPRKVSYHMNDPAPSGGGQKRRSRAGTRGRLGSWAEDPAAASGMFPVVGGQMPGMLPFPGPGVYGGLPPPPFPGMVPPTWPMMCPGAGGMPPCGYGGLPGAPAWPPFPGAFPPQFLAPEQAFELGAPGIAPGGRGQRHRQEQKGIQNQGEKGSRKGAQRSRGGSGDGESQGTGGPAPGKGRNGRGAGADGPAQARAEATAERGDLATNSETATTVMLRNIPNRYSQGMLLSLLDELSFKGSYDFVYLPMDFRNGVNLGYAFVNLLTHEEAMRLIQNFQGYSQWSFDSAKVCEVSWAHPHQGLDEHVERYRNSPVMHTSMPPEYKPMLFKDGVQVEFPPPTKVIRAPKLRPVHERSAAGGQGQAAQGSLIGSLSL